MKTTLFKSINPYNNEAIAEYSELEHSKITEKLEASALAFNSWRESTFTDRSRLMRKVGQLLKENVNAYSKMITIEMGKPINESKAEINKCALVCEYYADNAEEFLKDEIILTDAQKSFVRHDPIGCILAIMPWNFPFWQVFRFAAPTIMAGNVTVLKHAPNVFGCAELIEEVFLKAGFPKGVFQNMIFHHDKTEMVLSHDAVKAVSLTGSGKAGAAVASIAGKYIKKSLLELGGSNAFIVFADADIDGAVNTAVTARMRNSGQSCIAAKRFILLESIYDEFVSKFTKKVRQLKVGDPLNEDTQIGTLARIDLADQLQSQIKMSIDQGAVLLLGGEQSGCFHEPTILGNVTPGMPAFDEETFGPLAAIIKAKDVDEAIALSEMSRFGLGVTICTENIDEALSLTPRFSDGAVFINELVKSDPRLPFGGTKTSGYGRELSKDGILEFVNRQTVYVK